MRQNNGARAATTEQPATPKIAPRFTRAAQAERSRLEGKREQLLHKREAAQAEVEQHRPRRGRGRRAARTARAAARRQRQRTGAAGDDSSPGAERGAGGSERGEARERDRAQPADPQPAKE